MLRKDIELLMKEKNKNSIVIFYNKKDKLGMYCFLQSGYLVDCYGHRINRKKDIWGYAEYFGKGDADRIDFMKTERIPMMRGGKLCANIS